MEAGDDLSPIAKAWGVILGLAAGLILIVLTVAAFYYNVVFGVFWLFIGDPITAAVLWGLSLVLFAPVALVTGGAGTGRKTKVRQEAIVSSSCTLAGLLFADGDRVGVLDLRKDGLLFHDRGNAGQLFKWDNVGSFGAGEEKGLVISTSDGRWMLVMNNLSGAAREEWITALDEHGIPAHETVSMNAPAEVS